MAREHRTDHRQLHVQGTNCRTALRDLAWPDLDNRDVDQAATPDLDSWSIIRAVGSGSPASCMSQGQPDRSPASCTMAREHRTDHRQLHVQGTNCRTALRDLAWPDLYFV